jgi:hypothetical protein
MLRQIVIWSPVAELTYYEILEYLDENGTIKLKR